MAVGIRTLLRQAEQAPAPVTPVLSLLVHSDNAGAIAVGFCSPDSSTCIA